MTKKFSAQLVKVRSKNSRSYRLVKKRYYVSFKTPPHLKYVSKAKRKLRSTYSRSVR